MRNHEEKATSQVESLPYIAAQIADAPEQDPGADPTGACGFLLSLTNAAHVCAEIMLKQTTGARR